MKSTLRTTLVFSLALVLLVGLAPPMQPGHASTAGSDFTGETLRQEAPEAYTQLPLYFIANQGQRDESVAYYVQSGGHSLYFTAEEVVMVLRHGSGQALRHGSGQALGETVLRMRFVGAEATQPIGAEERAARVNYLIGNDPVKWQADIPTYGQVVYYDLYPGIVLRYAGQNGALKYTFVVKPGADISQIRLAYEGADSLRVDETGNLLILAGGGELRDTRPYAYQEIGGRRVEVDVSFELHGGRTYGFTVRSATDPRYPLVIDPTLDYSTYLGGGSDLDQAEGITVDGAGHVYVAGWTWSSDFPTQNAYQGTYGGHFGDAFVAKIDPTQSGAASLVYATYLGGESGDYGRDIAIDEAGNAYVMGTTLSPNFPTQNAYQSQCNQCDRHIGIGDIFVAKLNADGNGLLYSTYLGGKEDELTYGGIAVAGAGNVYVTGYTMSPDFPTTPGAYDRTCGTDNNCNYDASDSLSYFSDVFVSKIDTIKSGAASLVYSTYLGGSDRDFGLDMALDGAGNFYVTGMTDSPDFPTQNPYQGTPAGFDDVIVTKFNAAGTDLLYSTYLGGTGGDRAWDIAVDAAGGAYVTGDTRSTDFPTKNPYQGTIQSLIDGFVARIDTTQSGADSLVYSTYLGGKWSDLGKGIAVDGAGNAYVTGRTASTDFPITAGAFDTTCGTDGNCNYSDASPMSDYEGDAFVTMLNAAGNALLYSTYLGGEGDEDGEDIALFEGSAGNIYVTGVTYSTLFPTTQNAYQKAHAGGERDAFVSVLSIDSLDLSTSRKQVSPATIVPTGTVTHSLHYTITLVNTGYLTATAACLTDTLPLSLTLTTGPACSGGTCAYNAGNHVITWTGSLTPGALAVVTYTGLVSVPIGTDDMIYFVNTAQVDDGLNAPFTLTAWSAVNPRYIYLPIVLKNF